MWALCKWVWGSRWLVGRGKRARGGGGEKSRGQRSVEDGGKREGERERWEMMLRARERRG